MSTIRWGILSTADIAIAKVIPGMRKAERCVVAGIASRDVGRARATADRLDIEHAFGSYEALLASPDIDAVYIPLPNDLHAPWAIAAARAGKHVLCEKPLATTVEDAERIVAACEGAGVRLMEAFMYRLHPSWIAVQELVAAGRIGRLTAVHSWFSFYNDDPANIRNIAAHGGGALFDVGCYCVNLSRMVFGGEPIDVRAMITTDPVSGVDTMTSALLRFEQGIATFSSSVRLEDDQQVHIYGTGGRISIPIPFNIPPDRPTTVILTSGGDPPVAPDQEVFGFEIADPYTVEVERFSAAILDDLPTPTPPHDAITNLRVLDRIREAAAIG